MATNIFFPQEIIENILSRLPVKSLKSFRCVSRTWNCLITHPSFVKSHLSRSKQNDPIIMLNASSGENLLKYFMKSGDSPPQVQICSAQLWGSCDGLLCVNPGFMKDDHVVLWNPSTREYKELPVPDKAMDEPQSGFSTAYGFGYNPTSLDYQVLGLWSNLFTWHAVVKIYSLNNHSWRRIDSIPYCVKYSPRIVGENFDGKFYWFAAPNPYSRKQGCILAYDFGDEKFEEIQLPEFGRSLILFEEIQLPEFGRSLILFEVAMLQGNLFVSNDYDGYVEGWVMKDYGRRESWTQLFKIYKYDYVDDSLIPVFSTKEGIVVSIFRYIVFYAHTYYSSKDLDVYQANPYSESLVSLGVGCKTVGKADDWAQNIM
ncbi:hypothetical protein ACHQM5_027300 [Ranunculus cassubicifolius]